jgi:hypothetical protein
MLPRLCPLVFAKGLDEEEDHCEQPLLPATWCACRLRTHQQGPWVVLPSIKLPHAAAHGVQELCIHTTSHAAADLPSMAAGRLVDGLHHVSGESCSAEGDCRGA